MFSHTKKILNIFYFLFHHILFNVSVVSSTYSQAGHPSSTPGHCTPTFFIILYGVACSGCIAQQDMLALFFSWHLSFALWRRFFPMALSFTLWRRFFSLA
jgi:hypothetical protein